MRLPIAICVSLLTAGLLVFSQAVTFEFVRLDDPVYERNDDRFHISQVFVGPRGLVHCYRKTWLHRTDEDKGYRNELARYDPGTGPNLFEFDGVRAACFICADATAPRCIERLRDLQPQVVFHPNNHINRTPEADWERKRQRAKEIGAPVPSPTELDIPGCITAKVAVA